MTELTGGKLIGEGSSTCVFKPNLPCKNKKMLGSLVNAETQAKAVSRKRTCHLMGFQGLPPIFKSNLSGLIP